MQSPSHPQGLRRFRGKVVCVTGLERGLWPWFVSLRCWCLSPRLGSAGDCPASISTLAQQSHYLCGAVQARAHGCPCFSYLLKLGCCPSLCLHTHLFVE